MLVVILTAMASTMGLALLATSSLHAQAGSSTVHAAAADSLAESGINLAMYYLQNPLSAPLTPGASFWPGQTHIALGSEVAGVCDVAVTQLSPLTYRIVSTGRSTAIQRTLQATVELQYEPSVRYAMGSNSGLSLSGTTSVKGDLQVKGLLRVSLGTLIDGLALADNLAGLLPRFTTAVSTAPNPVPPIPSYRTYNWYGTTYSAREINADLQNVTLGPTADNPAGVYFSRTARKLKGNVTVNGTLVVETGNLQIAGANNQIIAQVGFPGLIVATDIQMAGPNRGLTVNGMACIGTGVTRGGLSQIGSKLNINGSVLFFGATPTVDSLYNGTMNITYDGSKVIVPGIGAASVTPSGLQILSWE